MSNVVCAVKEHFRSRSGNRRTTISAYAHCPPNPTACDVEFLRLRCGWLRQRALAEEDNDLVVSSPKDKNFQSLSWDELRKRQQIEYISSTPTPISEGYRTPKPTVTHSIGHPNAPPTLVSTHGRTKSNPSATTSTTSVGWMHSTMPACIAMTKSNSDPGPSTSPISTINVSTDKPLGPTPAPKPASHRATRSVDILVYPPSPKDSRPQIEKPSFIKLPRTIQFPPELVVSTPEYTNALKQWFPAMADTKGGSTVDANRQ